jgi:hypothetical protein
VTIVLLAPSLTSLFPTPSVPIMCAKTVFAVMAVSGVPASCYLLYTESGSPRIPDLVEHVTRGVQALAIFEQNTHPSSSIATIRPPIAVLVGAPSIRAESRYDQLAIVITPQARDSGTTINNAMMPVTITMIGVTSGIDFGLSVSAELAGEIVAQSIQLGIEYDPAPPFDAGHPDRAPEAAKERVSGRYERMRELFRASLADQSLA